MEAPIRRDGGERSSAVEGLEVDNGRLQRIIADLNVQNHILKEVTAENGKPVSKAAAREDERRRGLGPSGDSVPGLRLCKIELLSARPLQPRKSPSTQEGF